MKPRVTASLMLHFLLSSRQGLNEANKEDAKEKETETKEEEKKEEEKKEKKVKKKKSFR